MVSDSGTDRKNDLEAAGKRKKILKEGIEGTPELEKKRNAGGLIRAKVKAQDRSGRSRSRNGG